jgi:vancomycin resistance protein YoaR
MVLVGAGAAGAFWFDRAYADRVYPNVSLQGVPIGGTTRAQAQQAVETAFAAFAQQPVTLRADDRAWQPTLQDLGVTLDVSRSVDQAVALGRDTNQLGAVRQVLGGGQSANVPLQVVVDGAKLDAYLRGVAAEVEVKPQEATILFENGQVRTTPSQNGRLVLVNETASALVKGLEQVQPQDIALQTREVVPQITSERVAEVQRAVETIVGAPLDMVADNQTFTLDQQGLTEFLRVERVERDGVATLEPQLDTAKLESFLRDITARIGRAPQEPRVDWNNGQLQIVKEGTPGYGVDIERSMEVVNAAILTSERRVELPLGEVQPAVRADTLAELGITELIAEGKSYFTNSAQYRITNIKAGVNLVDGILVAPGAEFSFNDTVGVELDESKGFVQGEAIVDNKVVIEYGGGICQDSTTVYRAAFYAGLPITARTSHSSRLGFYEIEETVGMDAAIFTGTGPDLRFRNDTDHWILVDGVVNDEEQSVAFRLYGTNVPGRTVERSEPVVEYGRNGVQIVTVTRTIKQDGEVVNTEAFVSNFHPLQ